MRYVLGVDGGGSKCDAVLMDEEGGVLGWGRGGATHGLYVGSDVATASVRDAVLGAIGEARSPIARIAGAGPLSGIQEWLGQSLEMDQFASANEASMGYAMALATHGILVLSGTGSFVHGLTADGRRVHEGGDGPIIGDEGSAHHVGILGIRAAYRSHYTEARRTSLAEAVPRALGVSDLREVFHLLYVDHIGRSQVASVAKTVNEEAEGGDRIAAELLRCAAEELGELVVEVIRELGMESADDLMVATGSVAQGSRIFWERLTEIALGVAPKLRPVRPEIRPVMGACLLALRDLGVPWKPALVQRIVETQRPFADGLRGWGAANS